MDSETKVKELEISKIALELGQVLVVKIFSDDTSQEDLAVLKGQLQSLFPNNRIMLFALPSDGKIEMDVLDTREPLLMAKEPVSLCATPTAYCSNCNCGKKEALEGLGGK